LRRQKNGKAAREYLKGYLLDALMKGIHIEQVARELGVTTRTAYNYQKELREELGGEAKRMNPYRFYGQLIAEYDAMRALNWRKAETAEKEADQVKFAAEARAVMDSRDRFMKNANLYNQFTWNFSKDSTQTDEGARIDTFQRMLTDTMEEAFSFGESGIEPEPRPLEDDDADPDGGERQEGYADE